MCVIVRFLIVRATANFNHQPKALYEKVHDIVADDFLSVKIKPVEHLFVNLPPESDFGHVAGFTILTGITQQLPVLGKIVDIVVFDSDAVDDGHFFIRYPDI